VLIAMTLPRHRDIGFVHTFHDALLVSADAWLGVVLDLFPVWRALGGGGARRGVAQPYLARPGRVAACAHHSP
jgi:hypothetical protein